MGWWRGAPREGVEDCGAVDAAIVAAVGTAAAAVATAGTAYMCRTIEPYHMLWLVMWCMYQYQQPVKHTHDVALQ